VTAVFLVLGAGLLSLGLYLGLEFLPKNGKQTNMVAEQAAQRPQAVAEQPETSLNPRENPGEMLPDYDQYTMSKQEWLFYALWGGLFCFFIAYVFYRSVVLAALVTPLGLFYPRLKTREIIRQRKKELAMQFKEALYALSSSLSAGRSVEEAFKESLQDLALVYPDPQTSIIQEFKFIVRRLEMNETIEQALSDLARRAHLEDLENFVDVFVISKRTGGNIVEVIKNSSTIIGDKLQIKQEIETLLAERKFERKVLNIMPIGLILLLSWSTGDYMAPVFDTLAGHVAMTVAILLFGAAFVISGKIMNIEV
jgi:tight adherence protein B